MRMRARPSSHSKPDVLLHSNICNMAPAHQACTRAVHAVYFSSHGSLNGPWDLRCVRMCLFASKHTLLRTQTGMRAWSSQLVFDGRFAATPVVYLKFVAHVDM